MSIGTNVRLYLNILVSLTHIEDCNIEYIFNKEMPLRPSSVFKGCGGHKDGLGSTPSGDRK